MSKITTKLQKVFAATGPTGIVGQFGSLAAGSPTYTDDVETIQDLNEYGIGLVSALINGAPPAIQDINGLFYMITKQIAYLMQQGIPEWNADTTYYIGSFVTRPDGTDGEIFISVADDNLNNALTDTDYWMIYKSNKITSYSASNEYTVAYNDVSINYSFSSNSNIYLPEATSLNKGRCIFIINTSAYPNTLRVSATGTPYTAIDGQQYVYLITSNILAATFCKFVSNGSSWDSIDGFFLAYSA